MKGICLSCEYYEVEKDKNDSISHCYFHGISLRPAKQFNYKKCNNWRQDTGVVHDRQYGQPELWTFNRG